MGEPPFILMDERAMFDEDDAVVLTCEDTHRAAVAQAERFGFPVVIIGPDGVKEHYVPKAMRK